MTTRIPLRAYRVAPRKPWLAVDGADLLVRVPSWWGGRPWRVPLADVAVTDLALLTDTPPPGGDDPFAEPLVTPYVYTTGPMTQPNIALAFRAPVRVPDFRLLTRSQLGEEIPVRAARGDRPKGRYADGLLLRAADPAQAVETLVAAGAERVADPDAWLAARRDRATPEQAASLERVARRSRLAERVAVGLGAGAGVAFALSFVLGDPARVAAGGLALASFGTFAAGDWWVGRRMFRA